MKYEIECRPSYSVLEVSLDPGERIVAEAAAMAWMDGDLQVETSTRGGVLSGLKRSVLSGESFFQNTYTAAGTPGVIALAPGQPGDIVAYEMDDTELLLEKNAYLASAPDVYCDANFQGFSGLFNEGLFVLAVSGTGVLFFTGYGDIEEVQVDGSYIVDNGHAVAWEPTLEYELTRARRVRSFLFSDQILLEFHGQGKLWVQSRSPRALANWLHPFRRVKSESSDND